MINADVEIVLCDELEESRYDDGEDADQSLHLHQKLRVHLKEKGQIHRGEILRWW